MPNQNECDHVVGVVAEPEWRSILQVRAQEVSDYNKRRSTNPDLPLKRIHMKFDFCPDCGDKIKWKEIKEACDAENNE